MATSSNQRKATKFVFQNELGEEFFVKEEVEEDGSDDSLQQSSMSLDVLARVATETLERSGSDDSSSSRLTPKAKKFKTPTSRNNTDVMTLEQIRMLSDKVLVNTFAELSSDEIKRKYTYRCYLMSDKCEEQFSSFGNEMKARQCVKSHLLAHIGSLLQEECTPGKGGSKFLAEPINVRKRRLSGKAPKRKRQQTTGGSRSPTTSYMEKITTPVTTYTSIKSRKKLPDNLLDPDIYYTSRRRTTAKTKPVKTPSMTVVSPRKHTTVVETNQEEDLDLAKELLETLEMFTSRTKTEEENKRRQQEEEKQNIEKLSHLQPFMDHSYTTVIGPQVIVEAYGEGPQFDEEDDVDVDGPPNNSEQPPKDKTFCIEGERSSTGFNSLHVPVIRTAKMSVSTDAMPVIGGEEIVVQDMDEPEASFVPTSARPYPPMPKSDNSKTGKLMFPEEYNSSDDDLPAPPKGLKITNRKAPKPVIEGSSEWERKMALKCIRELRCQRKQEVSLVCKICQDKAFTATATLMYHYRSHAGIKPFVCLICNTTFTRQHSLNYHMLIHNNQSRFMCPDCGRKFRHPSHYKEHRRRHTGETPFHCMDCPLRFKTRNTYKRHLKTRHGKLLTADGIQYVSYDASSASQSGLPHRVRYRGIQASQKGIVLLENVEEDDDGYYNEADDEQMDEEMDTEDGVNVYIEEIEETAIENLE